MAPKPGSVYYPKYRDISAEESAKLLRQLELEAYSAVISALRSQGDLSKEKKALLNEICACLGVTEDRHKAEIRRAINDEDLATIALHSAGKDCEIEWIKEGRRSLRVPHRPLQITQYTKEADQIAELIAEENASVPEPQQIDVDELINKNASRKVPAEKPLEVSVQCGLKLHSDLFCVGCLSKQNSLIDASTSTDDLLKKNDKTDPAMMSDDCIYLPSGTVLRVSSKKLEKEEKDAYSVDTNMSGNYDFGSAPEINLSGSKGSRRKRKKSSGYIPPKEGIVTIRQVIKPPEEKSPEVLKPPPSPLKQQDHQHREPIRKEEPKPEFQSKHLKSEDDMTRSVEPPPKKKKKSPSRTVQHTPVPPEHLYAVGGNVIPKSRQPSSFLGEENIISRGSSKPDYIVSTEQSPTKHIGVQPHRSSTVSPNYSQAINPTPWRGSRETPVISEAYPRGFRYSPTKPVYRPPKVGPAAFNSRAPRVPHPRRPPPSAYPSVYSFIKQPVDMEFDGSKVTKRLPVRRDGPNRFSSDEGHRAYKPTLPSSAHVRYQTPDIKMENIVPIPVVPASSLNTETHSSTLDELASVSLMASSLTANSMVETGLAPVSAIVSRVTSPAPGQVSNAPPVKKSVSVPLVVSRIPGEEGASVQVQKIASPQMAHDMAAPLPTRQLSVMTSSFSGAKVKIQGSVSSTPTSVTQVRLAVSGPSNEANTTVPVSFTSSLPYSAPTSSAPIPRIISSIAAKSHAVLKSSTGNVITVTAKPLTSGARASVPALSGASIVRPQMVQKKSIIVVHKTSGAKLGKTKSANFPSIAPEGSKVITVSTKNLSSSSSEISKFPGSDLSDETGSESALGSIQGLVSGLDQPGIVKKAKVVGMKHKLITMPIHKKSVPGKIGEVGKSKIFQNIIKAPGKVLVKAGASTIQTGHLRNVPAGKVVKPVTQQELQSTQTHDIVAAALSQSLGPSATSEISSTMPSEGTNFVKLATSTPAASTIKAIAASYQKSSSTNLQKQIISTQPSVIGGIEKVKVTVSTLPNQSQPMLFTPNQPQIHRSPQGGSQRPKQSIQPTATRSILQQAPSGSSFLASVPRTSIVKPSVNVGSPSGSQPPIMQVKVLNPPTVPQPVQHSVLKGDKNYPHHQVDDLFQQTACAPEERKPNPASLAPGDRTTFIYQYHSTSHAGTQPSTILQSGNLPLAVSTINSGDLITLHSIERSTAHDVSNANVEAADSTQARIPVIPVEFATTVIPTAIPDAVPAVTSKSGNSSEDVTPSECLNLDV